VTKSGAYLRRGTKALNASVDLEYKDGRGWYFQAISDEGITENVGDFASDPEAKDWIVRKSIAYFKARQK
jgi:hypothetical protein